jgi:hypothetical protein
MNNFGSNIAGGFFIFAVVFVIIFLVFREVFCWYWKINQNVALLTEIRDLLTAKGNSQAEVDAGHTFVSAKNTTSPMSDQELMAQYGITFDGERYTYGGNVYDRLNDAINYAQALKRKASQT